MMLDYYIRPIYQRWLVDPLASKIKNSLEIHPNYITMLGAITGVICGLAIYLHLPSGALLL